MSVGLLNFSLFAVEALAASLVLPFLAWMFCLLQRERAAVRHLIWLSVFGALLLLPLLALLVPPQIVLQQAPAIAASNPPPMAMRYAAPISLAGDFSIPVALAAIWATGFFWNLLRLAVGLHGLHRLRRIGAPFDTGLDCDVRIAPTAPLTFGWRKPVILLPLDAPSWPLSRMEAVLGHEWAHVRRRDNLSNGLALLACALYWPNPLLWWARSEMCRAAEMAADIRVLAGGMKPSLYATELLALAAQHRGPVSLAAVTMASPSWLEARLATLLSPTQSRTGVGMFDIAGLACLSSVTALMLALVRPGAEELPVPAARPEGAAPAMMAAKPSVSLPTVYLPSDEAPVDAPNPIKVRLIRASNSAGVEPRIAAVDVTAAGSTPNAVANPQGDDDKATRDARLLAERYARESRLKQEAAQRRTELDAKFAQAKIERDARFNLRRTRAPPV